MVHDAREMTLKMIRYQFLIVRFSGELGIINSHDIVELIARHSCSGTLIRCVSLIIHESIEIRYDGISFHLSILFRWFILFKPRARILYAPLMLIRL